MSVDDITGRDFYNYYIPSRYNRDNGLLQRQQNYIIFNLI